MARSVIEGGLSKAAAARQFNTTPEDGRQMGQPVPRRGRGRLAATAPPGLFHRQAKLAPAACDGGRGFAPAAPHRQADRRRSRRFARHRQPYPQTAGASTACRRSSRSSPYAATNGPPRERSSTSTSKGCRREFGPQSVTSHHQASEQRGARPEGSAGNMCMWRSTITRAWASACMLGRRDRQKTIACAFLLGALRYYKTLGVKVERVMTDNGSGLQITALRQDCCAAWASSTSAHPPLHAQNQWQGRTLPSRPCCASGPMSAPTTPRKNAPPLQLGSTSWQHRRQTANQQTSPNRGQPVEAPHRGLLDHVPVLVGRNQKGATSDAVLPRADSAAIAAVLTSSSAPAIISSAMAAEPVCRLHP